MLIIVFFFKGDKVDISKFESVLGNLGIEFTFNECLNLLKILLVNGKFCGYYLGFLESLVLWNYVKNFKIN